MSSNEPQEPTPAKPPKGEIMAENATPIVKQPATVQIPYKVCYPAHDEAGGDLLRIRGAWIETKAPGDCQFRRRQFVDYTTEWTNVEMDTDGNWQIRHVVVGDCRESVPSDAVSVPVNLKAPGKPPKGEVRIPCPVCVE